jgi:predicted MPP superfamily phosphohydrolase
MSRHLAKELTKIVALPDLHIPHNINLCGINSFLKDFQPDYILLLGDFMNLDCVSHWINDRKRLVEGQRLLNEYAEANTWLDTFKKLCPQTKLVYFIGNHEDWVEQYIDRHPELEGLMEIKSKLKNVDQWVELNKVWRCGKLQYMHGVYTNEFHSKKTALAYGCSIRYGHTHDIQEYAVVTPQSHLPYNAKSVGCLCKDDLPYMKNKPNKWVNGFNYAYIRPDGTFNDYTVVINQGKFTVNGTTY